MNPVSFPKPSLAEWQAGCKRRLPAHPIGHGLLLQALYTETDLADTSHLGGLPGFAPFVRGVHPTMYVDKPWTIRQYAGFSTAEESNAFYRRALAGGMQGISVAFDLATHRGYDSDHPRVAGDVGKAGVAIDSVEDMKLLFQGIPLDQVSVSMTMNGAVLPVLAAFIVAAEEQGVDQARLSGTIQNDILKEFLVRNTYIYPPEPSMRIVADVMEYTARHMPRFNSISVSGYHMQEAGADPVLELGLTLADGLEYVRRARARGMNVDAVGERLSFFFGCGMQFYAEIAKLRAARLLWSEIMRAEGARSERALMLRTHCQTSGWSLTVDDPYNNVVRTTIEAMAAVFGGTQALHTNAFDEAVALPSDAAARIARHTQLILQEEAAIGAVVDPWGGSYMMERLTADLADAARAVLAAVEAHGGMSVAVANGWARARIESAAAARQAEIDAGRGVIVGVNRYRAPAAAPAQARRIDQAQVLDVQCTRLARLRAERDQRYVDASLAALSAGARGAGNLLALAVQAMRARATVGEVSEALESVWGRHQDAAVPVSGVYGSARADDPDWQVVACEVEAFRRRRGRAPKIMIAKLGQDGHDRGARLVASALSDAGFDTVLGPLFQTPVEAARAALAERVDVVGVSTLAGAHAVLVPALLTQLRDGGAGALPVFVGGVVPTEDQPALLAAGVRAVFGPGTPIDHCARVLLAALQQQADAA